MKKITYILGLAFVFSLIQPIYSPSTHAFSFGGFAKHFGVGGHSHNKGSNDVHAQNHAKKRGFASGLFDKFTGGGSSKSNKGSKGSSMFSRFGASLQDGISSFGNKVKGQFQKKLNKKISSVTGDDDSDDSDQDSDQADSDSDDGDQDSDQADSDSDDSGDDADADGGDDDSGDDS